ncbi:hypothetical protein [Desulfocicer vacuolatum]|uniref:hypothetical protein n=1 Tax=Desulfocicer vacuolatum TaxID=2298 RepID=UPI001BAFFF87|nr:hypothetical protein [Desulfocicer vacuolatum]
MLIPNTQILNSFSSEKNQKKRGRIHWEWLFHVYAQKRLQDRLSTATIALPWNDFAHWRNDIAVNKYLQISYQTIIATMVPTPN